MNTATADRTDELSTLLAGFPDRVAVVVHAFGLSDSRHVATDDAEYADLLVAAFAAAGYTRIEVEAA